MKNKRTIIIAVLVLLILSGFTYYFLTKEDKETTLNLIEKQWIETNKNDIIFISILNNFPVLSYNGEGLIIDFLNSLNEDTNLSFNKVSYKIGTDPTTDYAFKLVHNVTDKDLLIYKDNYVIVTKEHKSFKKIEDLKGLTIGVLNDDINNINYYLPNADVTYKTFASDQLLLDEFNKEDTELTAISLLKTSNLETIIKNNYTISYNIFDYTKSLVLSLGDTDKLNTILRKYYSKWSEDNYINSYNKYLSRNYFTFKNITDAEAVKFRSKKYYYGYIENGPYDTTISDKLFGINATLVSDFSKLSSAVVYYQKYNNITELVNAFNSNKIDLFYGIDNNDSYKIDVYNTINGYDNKYVVLSHLNNQININSLKSLNKVATVKDTKVSSDLVNITDSYNNLDELINKVNSNNNIVMDLNSYIYYKNELPNFIISHQFDSNDYYFKIRDTNENHIFAEMFDFHLSFSNNNYVHMGLNSLLSMSKTPFILKRIALVLGGAVIILLITLAVIKITPKKKKKVVLTKEDKLRYIDALTSLKNRNYLNDCIEKWDNSELYPQTIIIIDLNNIAYINDNYGHAEGDAVIVKAANILIQNQIENSEIIRTNGNEFLVYLVSTDEKQVITYIRKLNKELKELDHGFGAAIGYSMIQDAIKTIDDAINEATLDMRNNKEEG